jgi:hypothetical protein
MRMKRAGRDLLFLLCCLLALVSLYTTWPRQPELRDLGTFLRSAQVAQSGRDPYGEDAMDFYFMGTHRMYTPNANPPISVLLFEPLTRIDPTTVFRALYVGSLALYVWIVASLFSWYREQATPLRIAWAAAFAPLWATISFGQIYVPLAAATVWAYYCLRRGHPLVAGVLIGLVVAIKPNFGLWPVLLLLAGYTRPALAAGVTAAGLSVIPLIAFGPWVYRSWLQVAGSGEFVWIGSPLNASLPGLADRFGVAGVGIVAGGVVLAVLCVMAWRIRMDRETVSDLAVVGSLLAAPIGWASYFLLLLPALIRRPWAGVALGSAAAICLIPMEPLWRLAGFSGSETVLRVAGSVHNIALILIAGAFVGGVFRGERHAGSSSSFTAPVIEGDDSNVAS